MKMKIKILKVRVFMGVFYDGRRIGPSGHSDERSRSVFVLRAKFACVQQPRSTGMQWRSLGPRLELHASLWVHQKKETNKNTR